ncbi:hypothetical protein M422DRAFT_53602 [Sphaerobolus stellatus SS14]|uniref:Uncharacterized protein n=1 Tax=Sphaerobolus stellatus (strain SS14) TaxID=990650 RepID=A0A0C9UZI5_SPHS4|nr:hypothetical protein M422DRAFT_53602 [Sphaerobolus stellatus SS14]
MAENSGSIPTELGSLHKQPDKDVHMEAVVSFTGVMGDASTESRTAPDLAAVEVKKLPRKRKGKQVTPSVNDWTKPTDKLSFRPFLKISRGDEWAITDEGKHWITQRLSSFSNMRPPGGILWDEAKNRECTHRQWWIKELAKAYITNWPDFDLMEVLGADYTEESKQLHNERVPKFIEYALRRQYGAGKDDPTDIISLIVNRTRKPVAYNVWAQSNDDVDTKAKRLGKLDARWANPKKRLSTLMEMRKQLFEALPAEEQAVWEVKAAESKAGNISPEECVELIPKIYGMIGDSMRAQIQFNCVVLCGGKMSDGQAWFYTEEWHRPSLDDPLVFTSSANWKTFLGAFLHSLSKDTGVTTADIVQLPTWQRPTEFIPKVVVKLSDILEFDKDGELITSEAGVRQAAEKHLNSLWALVPATTGAPKTGPIPWTKIRQNRHQLDKFVHRDRLPRVGFIFERPKDMPWEDLLEFITHIIKGEKGELEDEKVFRWTGQGDGNFQLAPKPRRQKRSSKKKGHGKKVGTSSIDSPGETFDLDGIASDTESKSEAEERKPSKPQQKGKEPAKAKSVQPDKKKYLLFHFPVSSS